MAEESEPGASVHLVGAENLCHLCRYPLGAVGSVPCLVHGWQVLALPDVR
jgi:hypothetical protein